VTIPATTGTLLTTATAGVPINGPAFSAVPSAATTLVNTTFVKTLFATEVFDTNSNFTSSRFTPTVAGYYQINGTIAVEVTAATGAIVLSSIFYNGNRYRDGSANPINNSQGGWSTVSSLIYMNGSTDYVELFGYIFNVATLTTQLSSSFSGCLVRSAT
jgi:hypothetical protein